MKNVLFLCTGNSCRSQMAEGIAKQLKGDAFNFYSAGTKKHGLNPLAVEVMAEIGIDISNNISKTTGELKDSMDFVFTVCSNAQNDCPYFPEGKIIHKGFDDPPALAKGIEDAQEVLELYRRVRDEIKEMVEKIETYME